ncbi:MAG: carboxypeptidase-like regulatory domain-containing protein, partial [Candidatus Acidiferrales bacterium]
MLKRLWTIAVGVCCVVLLSVPAAEGQAVYGRVYGTVTDPSGAAIPGAKVVVTSVGQGTTKETSTN